MSLLDDLKKSGQKPVVQTPFNSGGGYTGNSQQSGGTVDWYDYRQDQQQAARQERRNPLLDDLESSGTKPEVDLYQLAYEQAELQREREAATAAPAARKAENDSEKKSVWDRIKDFFTKDRAKNVADAAISGTAAGYTGAERVLYEAGQGGRTALYQEEADEARRNLEQAQRDLEQAKANGFSERDIASIQNRIDTWQQRYDALTYVTDNEVQQKATAATSDLTQQLEKRSQKATEKAKQGTGKFGSLAVDVAVNMMQMAGDAGVSAVTGGSALLPMGFRVLGQGASEAQQTGGTLGQQLGYGAAAAGIEIFTEKLFNGVAGIYGAGTAENISEAVVRKLGRTAAGQSALRFILGMNEEGLEEVISDILSPLAKTIYTGKSIGQSYADELSLSDMLYDYIVGAAASGGTTAVNVANPFNSTISQYREANAENARISEMYRNMNENPNIFREFRDRGLVEAIDAGRDIPARQQARADQLRQGFTGQSTEQAQQQATQQTQSTQETGRQLVRQTISSMDVSQAEEQVLMSGFEAGEADAQTYANGIREAYRLGELGESLESAREQAQFGTELNETQFRHAWQLGAQKAGNATAEADNVSREAYTMPEYESIEDFAQTFPQPEKVTEILTAALNPLNMADLNQVAQAFKTAYDMGQSGVSSKYFTPENIYGLTREQAQTAYELGQADAAAQAEGQAGTIGQGRREGNLARARGTVKGEGVSMADLKAAFNDPQRTAYRLLTQYAETTGVNIVLYNSQADTSGRFPGQQGRFEWKDNTIYIDINSGVSNIKSVGDLGQYTMMRTFAHEFTHFIEKWNPAQYNEFREFVFASLEEKGENVHDLIQGQQMRDASGKMSYEQASREVVADAMMDILPDSRLVQQLADEHTNVFTTLRRKLREFTARMKQHYKEMSRKAPREAEALKANGAYADSLVQMWDRIAKGAVENYQSANGEPLFDQPGKPDGLPKRNARQQRNNAQIREENAQNGEEMPAKPETRPASIDFFARSEGYKARITSLQKVMEEALDDDYAPLDTMPDEVTLSNGAKYYRFNIEGRELFFEKDTLDYFDGGRMSYKQMNVTWTGGRTQTMDFIRATDENGDVIGYVLATVINPALKITREMPGKLKSFKPGKAKKATKTTPAPARAEPAPAPTRTTEAQEKPAEAKGEAKSRFPLQEWKKGTPSQKAAYRILTEYLRTGKGLPSKDLYAICDEAFGGTQAEGTYNRKDAYDAMELAVNRYLLEVMKYYNTGAIDNAVKGVEKALEIVNRLPTQNVRTKEQLEYQQFSTPPSIAYIAAWAANINAQDHVLEPSAGIGGLAAFAKAWGAEVTVNELSERRLEVLRAMGFDHIFNENAEHIDNILPDDIRPTAVIMNPPFSSTAGRTTTNKTSNAEAHINSALDRLAENGRLVAILGRGMADDKYGKYWDRLRKEYTIRANIGIDGENYKKYGTTFDVQIVVIDKVGPQGEARTFTGSYKNLVDAIKALEGTRNDRSAEVEQQPRVTGNPEAVATGSGEEQAVHPPVAEGDTANSGRAVAEPGPEPGGEREPGGADVQRSERGAESVPDARTGERGAVEQQRPGKKNPGSRKAAQRNDGLQPDAGATGAVSDVQGEPGQQRGGLSAEPARARQVSADPVTDDGVYTGYRAPDIPLKGTKAHPAVLVESAAMGAVDMPKATYTPHLPDSVTKTGALSTEQLVSVTYAGQAHEQMLPNGERRGFFVGDGTGVGKGRTICGVILDNFNQGRRKAVWITERSNLLTDAVRDWTAISGRDKSDIKDLSKVKLGQKVDHKEGILFTTYATLRSEKGNLSRLDQIIDWLGKDFDGVLVFDEAHNMGNLQGKTGGWGKKGSGGASMAIAGAELQKRLPKARVLYCSATAATEVSGLAFASRLGLWGEGTAFTDVNDFVSKIGSAGLSAMELVVRDMKAMGMYLARSVSFNGVEYDTIEHKLDPMQREIYNTMSRAWQKTMQSVEQSLAETGARHNSQAKQRAIGQYYNSIQRFYNQVLTSMSMPSVIADIKKELAAGRSCVLQIVNTNQAEAERQISAIKAREGDLDEMDLTPRGTLIDYLMKYYPVQLFEEYTDEHGNIRSKPVTNSKGEAVIDKKAVARRDALIQEINEMSIPDGPLEMLFDAFGTEAVAEITGRSRRVVPRRQQDGSLVRVEESHGAAAREADVKAFQDGEKRILIFSDAGGTGKSYHADLNAKNQQQRVHYVVQPGWQASKAVQGFGRTNRSNQASAPIYKLVTTDVKGQKRFTSTIARRLDQLGALTKGQRDTGSGMFGASDNLETDLARDSLREFYRRLGMGMLKGIDGRDTLQKMGLLNKFSDEYGNFKMDEETARNIGRFLNRILALEIDEQNRVFDAFIEIYEAEMEAAIKAGTLDLGMENVRADKIEILDDKTIYKQEGTGAETHYVQAKVYTRPEILESVAAAKKISWGRTFMGLYRTKGGDVRAVYEMPDKTDQYGRVHKQYRLQSPNYSKTSTWIDTTFAKNADAIPEAEWDAAWAEEVKKVPEYNEEVKHMLTGSLLPVWDRIENDGIAKVQRLISDDGKAYLGRIIPADRIDNVLGRFHVARTKESYTGKSVMQRIIQRGETYQLAYYRAKLFRSRVSGEYRLEYSQPQNTRFVQQQFPGIMMERINYVDRFFIPLNEKGEALLDKMLTNNPVANVVERGDNTTEYSTRREDSMSNRDVLAAAAAEMDAVELNDAERGALNIFRERLTRLQEEQEHRQELGQQYREQQFTKGGSRQEADRIRAAMQVADSKIRSLENSLLSLENKEVLKGVLIKARGVIEAEERRLGDEKLKRYRERRNESLAAAHYRERVRQTADTLRKWLMSPSNKDIRKHVPAEIQKSVADFLESINLISKTALRTGGLETTKADEAYLKNMKRMRDAIKENADFHGLYSGYSDLPEDFLDRFQEMIDKTERLMAGNSGGFVVNRMNARELQDLYRILRTLRKFIVEMNSFHNNAVFKHAYDAGEETIGHLGKFAKSRKSGMIYNFLRFQYMRPSYAFEHFGKGGQSIEKEFRDGQAVQADLANKIVKFATDTYKGNEVKAWSEEVKTFTLASKETISLPVTHIMSLYCLNRRAQALTHIYGDGIRVANYKADGKVHLDEGHLVSIGDVQKMIQTLTPRQIEVADALQKYMSTECAAWGNYVSMKRFDVEQFGEENYFPINSDGRYLPATAEESPDNSGLYALLNMGFTKELKENASNRIILYNIFDVFANHTASMTQYRSFALPVLDALKWFNYKNEATSVRDKLSLAFGAPEETRAGSGSKGYAEQFVINLIRAYNGTSVQGDPYDAPGMMGLHRFNRAQIAFNARVVIQQPMSITRAAMMLPPAKLMAGLGMSATHLQSLAAEMEEHSGIAKWKRLGFYDTNISRGLTELIKQNPSFGDRVTEAGTKGAETADRLTWAAMWYAAKASVKRSSYESEAAYFQAVTDLFEDTIYKTQVVDSVLTKGEFLRAKGFFPRMLGSFMSEPMATVSMLTDAYYKYTDDVQQGLGRSEAWRRNGANIARTAAVYTIGQILLAGMQSIMDGWRDDEEYDVENPFNNFLQRYLNAFKTNVIEELQPFSKIPLVSELYEALKSLLDYGGVFDKLGLDMYGNDISNGWAQYAKYLQKAAEITIDHLKEGGKTNYTWYGAIYNLIRGVAGLTGYPIATAWREVQDVWNNTVGYVSPRLKLDTYRRAIDRQYIETVRPTGLAQKTFEKILADADAAGDGNGSLKQDELGAELLAAMQRGEINEEQADAIWRTKWNSAKSKTFAKWREEGGAPAPAADGEATATAAVPMATPEPKASGYEQFKSSAPLYSTKRDNTYSAWETYLKPAGMSLDRFTEILTMADTDGNGSLKQDELGYALRASVMAGEMSFAQASVVWDAQGWKHNLNYWAGRH